MLDLLNCGKGKLEDPIIMEWALRRYEAASVHSKDLCKSMEETWFGDSILLHWIDAEDEQILSSMFRRLPSDRFSNVRSTILERWKSWSGPISGWTMLVIMENPADAAPLFVQHIENEPLEFYKTQAVIGAISDLPEPTGMELLRSITKRAAQFEDDVFEQRTLLEALVEPTAALDPSSLPVLADSYLNAPEGRTHDLKSLLRAICSAALTAGSSLFDHADSLIDGKVEAAFSSFRRLFVDGAPLEDIDRILDQLDPIPDALALLEKHRATTPTTTMAQSVIDTIRPMADIDDNVLACFAVAAVMDAYERTDNIADNLSMGDALDLLTLDVSENRHFEALTEHLRSFDAKDVAASANERMPSIKDSWGGVHLAKLLGELRAVDSIPVLIESMNEYSGDYLCEEVETALTKIGEPAQLALIAQWESLDRTQQNFGRGVLEQKGGRHAADFAIAHFTEMSRDDMETWCYLAEAAPDERVIALLEPELRRKQDIIDETFYILSVLTGCEQEDLKDIRQRIMDSRERAFQRIADFTSGKLSNMGDTVFLPLKCKKCGDVNRYEVKNIDVGDGKSGPLFSIRDEFPCASCGKKTDFEVTSEGLLNLSFNMMAHSIGSEAKSGRIGPFQSRNVLYRGDYRTEAEVLEELTSEVAENPDSIEAHLRLGRAQYRLKHGKQAVDCYNRALELEPNSMEAGLGLAQVKTDAGLHDEAFLGLRTMLDNKDKWRFFRVDEVSPALLSEEFAELHNELLDDLGRFDTPPLKPSFLNAKKKVGRNDPCPCGSGKKYKKCCLK